MFNIEQVKGFIKNNVQQRYAYARSEIFAELKSPGYEEVIKNVNVSIVDGDLKINIEFQKGIDITNQDFFELLAQGGVVVKDDKGERSYIKVAPSLVMRKYIGKR